MSKDKPAYDYNPKTDCNACFGRGYTVRSEQNSSGNWVRQEETCGQCEGTGMK